MDVQKHIDFFNTYLKLFKFAQPTAQELDRIAEGINTYDPLTDGYKSLEVPRALADILFTVFHYRLVVSNEMKDLFKNSLRTMLQGLKDKDGAVKTIFGGKIAPPELPPALQDRARFLTVMDDLAWNLFRLVLEQEGITENAHTAVGIRKGRDNSIIILALPDDFDDSKNRQDKEGDKDDENGPENGIGNMIGEILSDLFKNDAQEPAKEAPAPGTPQDGKEEGNAGSLDDIMKNLGITTKPD